MIVAPHTWRSLRQIFEPAPFFGWSDYIAAAMGKGRGGFRGGRRQKPVVARRRAANKAARKARRRRG